MPDDLVNAMVPVLGRSLDPQFNVFDVMRHGMHEKQLSNVFGWLLDTEGTHGLGDRFVRVFVGAINRQTDPAFDVDDNYWVSQEVNTSADPTSKDIADIVLTGDRGVMVVENYFTSDGHTHCYGNYLTFGERDGRRGRVVLLCGEVMSHLQTRGWENAAVVTYGQLIDELYDGLNADRTYQRTHAEAYAFIDQIHRKFSEEARPMNQSNTLDFVIAMCSTGEARRYQSTPVETATNQFATDFAAQARERFVEGRDLLQEAKGLLRGYSANVLGPQLNDILGEGVVSGARANLKGVHQWTIYFDAAGSTGVSSLRIKFGPSAWAAVTSEQEWPNKPDEADVDYGHLFACSTEARVVQRSSVTLAEVLAGLDPQDVRLRDELLGLIRD